MRALVVTAFLFSFLSCVFGANVSKHKYASKGSVKKESVFTVDVLSSADSSSGLTVSVGNDKFTIQMGQKYGTKLLWKENPEDEAVDLVGSAVGLYASYQGAAHDITYDSIHIEDIDSNKIDVSFNADEGEHHLVLFKGLNGFYSYFVNKALPDLGEFRTLIRLNPDLYQNAHTSIKDEALPVWPDDYKGEKVFDETWVAPDGNGYITKYDWSSRLHEEEIYGVYGTNSATNKTYGFWLISPGRDYFTGDQIKQELLVHRESSTGDVVLLNMLHGTHFQVDTPESFPVDKLWGPYLFYFNNGDISDANRRMTKERLNWPYKWLSDSDYLSRGSVKGRLVLSDGTPASNVNLFLGKSNNYTMLQGADYQYYSYTDDDGNFEIKNVRTNQKYWLQAFASEWSDIDVIRNYTYPKQISVKNGQSTSLGSIKWSNDDHDTIWQIGTYDRTTKGFKYGALKYENYQTDLCPGDYDFYVNETSPLDWCFAKSKAGTWTVHFALDKVESKKDAKLYVSLAGYTGDNSFVGSNSTMLKISVNGNVLGEDEYGTNLYNDKSTYRSSSFAGNWFYSKLNVPNNYLKKGNNTVDFITTDYVLNHGILWDSVKLVWQ